MLSNQLQNLKTLIQSSPILNPSERSEWLGLLELMNDKQLGELEGILAAHKDAGMPGKPAAAPAPAAAVSAKPGQPGPLRLSHIMNLPNISLAVKTPGAAAPQTQPQQAVAASLPQKPKMTFGQKLKDMLAEKELPEGRVKPVPELQSSIVQQPRLQVSLPEVVKTQALSTKINLPPPVPKPRPIILESKAAPEPLVPPPVPMPAKQSNGYQPTAPGKKESGLQFVQADTQTMVRASSAATNRLIMAKQQPPQAKNNPSAAAASAVASAVSTPASATVHDSKLPHNLEDVAGLSLQEWLRTDTHALAQELKKFSAKSGYHDVIFNLEKSPLYKAYLETGIKSLSGEEVFGADSSYFTREQFEKFTDMLREVQGG